MTTDTISLAVADWREAAKIYAELGRDDLAQAFIDCADRLSALQSPPAATVGERNRAAEWGEYLAKDAEYFLRAFNEHAEATDPDVEQDDEAVEHSTQSLAEAYRALETGIYEFRKRAPPALTPQTVVEALAPKDRHPATGEHAGAGYEWVVDTESSCHGRIDWIKQRSLTPQTGVE